MWRLNEPKSQKIKIVIGQFEFRANRRRAGHATGFRNKSTTAAHNFMKTIQIVSSCNELLIEKKIQNSRRQH